MKTFIQKENCEATELDGEWIVLNAEQCTVTKLNEVGGRCWSLLKQAQTVDSLTENLLETFPGEENAEQVRRDTKEFLENLLQYGLIQPC